MAFRRRKSPREEQEGQGGAGADEIQIGDIDWEAYALPNAPLDDRDMAEGDVLAGDEDEFVRQPRFDGSQEDWKVIMQLSEEELEQQRQLEEDMKLARQLSGVEDPHERARQLEADELLARRLAKELARGTASDEQLEKDHRMALELAKQMHKTERMASAASRLEQEEKDRKLAMQLAKMQIPEGSAPTDCSLDEDHQLARKLQDMERAAAMSVSVAKKDEAEGGVYDGEGAAAAAEQPHGFRAREQYSQKLEKEYEKADKRLRKQLEKDAKKAEKQLRRDEARMRKAAAQERQAQLKAASGKGSKWALRLPSIRRRIQEEAKEDNDDEPAVYIPPPAPDGVDPVQHARIMALHELMAAIVEEEKVELEMAESQREKNDIKERFFHEKMNVLVQLPADEQFHYHGEADRNPS